MLNQTRTEKQMRAAALRHRIFFFSLSTYTNRLIYCRHVTLFPWSCHILQLPISYCVGLIMVRPTINRHVFINIFQMEQYFSCEIYKLNMRFLVIPKSPKVLKKSKKSDWAPLKRLLKHYPNTIQITAYSQVLETTKMSFWEKYKHVQYWKC